MSIAPQSKKVLRTSDDNKNNQQNDINDNIIMYKSFNNIKFYQVEDKFSITIEYDSRIDLLSLKFINQVTKNVFQENFDKESIAKISEKCELNTKLIVKMIIDTLNSKDDINKNIRIYYVTNMQQATTKYNVIKALKTVPNATNIPSGYKPILNNDNNQERNHLLFVLHFDAPPYIYFNYVFILNEKDISENDKLSMKLDDIQRENELLNNQLINQQQQIIQLTERLIQLENRFNVHETKIEKITLDLQNNWANYMGTFAEAKAVKIGHVVYLEGLIKSGASNTVIATLPINWRPTKRRIFNQNQDGKSVRVDIFPNGQIKCMGGYVTSWLPLDGINFVTK